MKTTPPTIAEILNCRDNTVQAYNKYAADGSKFPELNAAQTACLELINAAIPASGNIQGGKALQEALQNTASRLSVEKQILESINSSKLDGDSVSSVYALTFYRGEALKREQQVWKNFDNQVAQNKDLNNDFNPLGSPLLILLFLFGGLFLFRRWRLSLVAKDPDIKK